VGWADRCGMGAVMQVTVVSCEGRAPGSKRVLGSTTSDFTITELLVELDDEAMSLSYLVHVDGSPLQELVGDLGCRIVVLPIDGTECTVRWCGWATPVEGASMADFREFMKTSMLPLLNASVMEAEKRFGESVGYCR